MRIQYTKTRWWKFIHYNYFHKKLFKEYYVRKKRNFTDEEIKKYKLYQKYDDLITLRNIDWLRIFLWGIEA